MVEFLTYREIIVKKRIYMFALCAMVLSITACGASKDEENITEEVVDETVDDYEEGVELANVAAISLEYEVMDRILADIGLENAIPLAGDIDGIEDLKDAVYLMCKSEDGKFEVYGFVSPEYGCKGILINNIIDGEANHNYFYDEWAIGEKMPSIERDGEGSFILNFTQHVNGNVVEQSVIIDSFETGTVQPREDVPGEYLIENIGRWSEAIPYFLFENNQLESDEIIEFLNSENYSADNWLNTFTMEPSTREQSDDYYCYFPEVGKRQEVRIYANKSADSITKLEFYYCADPVATCNIDEIAAESVYETDDNISYKLNQEGLNNFIKGKKVDDFGFARLSNVDLVNDTFQIVFDISCGPVMKDEYDNVACIYITFDASTGEAIEGLAAEKIMKPKEE